jgi:AmiR/NasT family two-component response regulator
MFTSSDDASLIANAFKAGVTLSLQKPFGPKELNLLLNACRGKMLGERRRHQRV